MSSDKIEGGLHIEVIPLPEERQCQRCWNRRPDVGHHDYWPCFQLCQRCVGVLLELKWLPFIVKEGKTDPTDPDFCFICRDEKEWHEIKAGKVTIDALEKERGA